MRAHRLRPRGGPTGSRSHVRAEEPGQSAHQPSARTGNSSARSGAFGRPARRQPLDTLRTPPSEAASPAFKPNAARGCAQPIPLGVLARPVALFCRAEAGTPKGADGVAITTPAAPPRRAAGNSRQREEWHTSVGRRAMRRGHPLVLLRTPPCVRKPSSHAKSARRGCARDTPGTPPPNARKPCVYAKSGALTRYQVLFRWVSSTELLPALAFFVVPRLGLRKGSRGGRESRARAEDPGRSGTASARSWAP
jgi:hypothetical protein